MTDMTLDEFLAWVEARKAELGIVDTSDRTEAMRNKGGNRTAEKRELLRRVKERANAAGLMSVKANY